MYHTQHHAAVTMVGLSIRTRNHEAEQTIPALWQQFSQSALAERIPQRVSDTVYAVYADFDGKPQSLEGIAQLGYTLTIGYVVSKGDAPQPVDDLHRVTIPTQNCAVFDVPQSQPHKVYDQWQEIWTMSDLPRSFVTDFETFEPDGTIKVWVGLNPA